MGGDEYEAEGEAPAGLRLTSGGKRAAARGCANRSYSPNNPKSCPKAPKGLARSAGASDPQRYRVVRGPSETPRHALERTGDARPA